MVAGRRIRFTAVLVGVVLALTGFSSHGGSSSSGSSGSSGKSKSSSSSGGGCSSSKSKKKSHGSGDDNGTATASPSASASGAPATAVVVTCVGATPPVTTVRFTSNVDRKATFAVNLYREGANGAVIESTEVEATLEARETRTVEVALAEPSRAAEVTTCRIGPPRESSGTRTPGPARTTSGGSTPTPGSTPKKSTPKSTRKP
ncbi:hypothetical protein [Streptomyces xanthophaeus]|uniref:hypothetical protein n=1 Tax=Streptomyces xanthophaeus TaxID=67385 RepID=UPI002649DDDA|nr:hypothetical protein [Streptomyces xanthophaeus]WKD34150.1 hypothetical protein KO717_20745 [Streptomyces xanthophaeus]